CDTGIGIPENVQKRLFTSFHQADSSTSKEFGGTGLGLSISRKLAESMKGQISVESKPDEGACFSVILPLIKQHQENGGTEPAPYSGQQCLILDSHHLCGLSIGHHIEALGMEASVHDFSDPTSMYPDYIDLVILSFSPPYIREGRVDTAIQNIQAITDAPILALMSTSEYGLLNRVKQLGVAQSMSRPLGHESLCRSIDEIMSGESDSQFVTPKEFVPLFSRFRFLVADDNPINLKLITTILSTTKAAIDTAENGREVVSLVSKQKYDIILLDVHMPVMDGIEATKIIRKSESAEKRTPIVALTADTVPEHRSQVMKSGVDGYLLKPVEEQELWTILSQLLGIEFNNTIDTDIGKSTSPENKWVNKADLPSRDIEAGLKISGGRQELADSIFIQFMQELPRHLDVLRKAHKTFQYAKIKERSHLLHGATAVCGVPAINAMVDKLERIALDKDDEKIKALFIQIEKEVNKLSKIKERLNMSDSQS
ncbi:MAG: response regulator, partial [Gammaproteobacteria bacterium]|nr:response regulator [Gammaproteobacteria bacterium]